MSTHDPAFPHHLCLEVTNACDLACRLCSFHGDGVKKQRPVQLMDESVWRAAIDELGRWDRPLMFQPWGIGEPLLHPRFWDIVSHARSKPKLAIGFYTNGMQWDDEDVRLAIEHEVDWICISVDGVRKDVFEHYRVGSTLEKVIGTVRALRAERDRRGASLPSLRVSMVAYDELRDHIDEFVAYWRGVVDEVAAVAMRPPGHHIVAELPIERAPCHLLEKVMIVAASGGVGRCCEDSQGEFVGGWFPQRPLLDIWRNGPLAELRRAHRELRFDDPFCASCNLWNARFAQVEELEGMTRVERTSGVLYRFPESVPPSPRWPNGAPE